MSPRRVDSTEAASLEALRTENQALRVENQILKDEIARLKGLPPRPPARPRPSSGMETATDPSRSKRRKGRRQTRGAKRDSDRVTREVIVTAEVPEGSRFKGYETLLVRDLALSAEVLRYRRERWVTPAAVCCMDQGCGRNDPFPVLGSCDADGLRASQLQHAVQDLDGDVHLGRPTLIRTRAQPVPDHALEPADGGLGAGPFRVS